MSTCLCFTSFHLAANCFAADAQAFDKCQKSMLCCETVPLAAIYVVTIIHSHVKVPRLGFRPPHMLRPSHKAAGAWDLALGSLVVCL